MEITIISKKKKDYLLIETKAILVTTADLISQSQLLYDEIVKHDFKKALIDESDTRLPNDLIPYFDLVKNYVAEFPAEIRQLKIAIVTDKAYEVIANTWETLCASRGLNYCAFTSIGQAEEWLLG